MALARIVRAPHAIDNDTLNQMAVDQYRAVREEIRVLETRRKRLAEVMAQTMRENGATELTLGGVPVARLTEFDREDVSAKALRAADPALAERLVTVTHVVRVDLP